MHNLVWLKFGTLVGPPKSIISIYFGVNLYNILEIIVDFFMQKTSGLQGKPRAETTWKSIYDLVKRQGSTFW